MKTAKPSVVVVGSSNTDMIIKLEHLPKPGETILGGEFVTVCGGKGANQAVGAARAGAEVTFVGRVGRDAFGDMALDCFTSYQICTDFVFRDSAAPSGVALIFVSRTGQNSIAVAPGANGKLTPADVRKARAVIADASVLVAQLETPLDAVQEAIRIAHAAGVRVILNPAPARKLPGHLLKQVYLLTPNEHEAELLTGIEVDSEASAVAAARALLSRGVQNVIITMGARGAFVAAAREEKLIPGYKVKAVDATGAGDIFNGSLAVAIAEGQSLSEAAAFANAAAAIAVTRLGAQSSVPDRKEIEQLLRAGRIPRPGLTGNGEMSRNGTNGSERDPRLPSGRSAKFVTPL